MKINLKWVMDLNVKNKSISLFKKENLGDLKLVKKCLDLFQTIYSTKNAYVEYISISKLSDKNPTYPIRKWAIHEMTFH